MTKASTSSPDLRFMAGTYPPTRPGTSPKSGVAATKLVLAAGPRRAHTSVHVGIRAVLSDCARLGDLRRALDPPDRARDHGWPPPLQRDPERTSFDLPEHARLAPAQPGAGRHRRDGPQPHWSGFDLSPQRGGRKARRDREGARRLGSAVPRNPAGAPRRRRADVGHPYPPPPGPAAGPEARGAIRISRREEALLARPAAGRPGPLLQRPGLR